MSNKKKRYKRTRGDSKTRSGKVVRLVQRSGYVGVEITEKAENPMPGSGIVSATAHDLKKVDGAVLVGKNGEPIAKSTQAMPLRGLPLHQSITKSVPGMQFLVRLRESPVPDVRTANNDTVTSVCADDIRSFLRACKKAGIEVLNGRVAQRKGGDKILEAPKAPAPVEVTEFPTFGNGGKQTARCNVWFALTGKEETLLKFCHDTEYVVEISRGGYRGVLTDAPPSIFGGGAGPEKVKAPSNTAFKPAVLTQQLLPKDELVTDEPSNDVMFHQKHYENLHDGFCGPFPEIAAPRKVGAPGSGDWKFPAAGIDK